MGGHGGGRRQRSESKQTCELGDPCLSHCRAPLGIITGRYQVATPLTRENFDYLNYFKEISQDRWLRDVILYGLEKVRCGAMIIFAILLTAVGLKRSKMEWER
jgi:hypothetical protein